MTQSSSRDANKEINANSATPDEPSVEELQRQLAAAKQEMQAFAYSVSHDLRAPIRAIEGFSKILLEDFSASLDPEGKRFLQHIIANTQVLGSQIEDLLRYYRIAKEPPNKVKVDTSALVQQVVQDETTKAKTPAVDFKVDQLPALYADPALFRHVLSELISNAIKFSKNAKPAVVEVSGNVEDGQNILCIKDNGVGFDAKYAGKLFQVFQKLHPIAEYPGNGIGLALARRVTEMHGGRIWAESAAGAGAKFCVALPANP